MPVTIDLSRCDGNAECVKACAFAAIEVRDGKAVVFENCTDCGACVLACAPTAIWSALFSAKTGSAILAVDFSSSTGTAAPPSLGIAAQRSSGIAAPPSSGTAAPPSSGIAAPQSSGIAAPPSSGTAAPPSSGIAAPRSSGIAAQLGALARASEGSATWMTVDSVDAGAAADALVTIVKTEGYSMLVLPHVLAGPAIAARVAGRLGAALLSGCGELTVDESGGARASRPRYGGTVRVKSRVAPGMTVATLYPRGKSRIDAQQVEIVVLEKILAGDAPLPAPAAAARRIVSIGSNLTADADRTARACAEALGAVIVDPAFAIAKPLSPDLYIAFGVEGSTEHNASFRNSRVVVAIVTNAEAPIMQIADFLLVGDVEEHAKALLAAL